MLKKVATILVVLITILSMAVIPPAQACSRLVYESSNGPITARSMDWFQDPDAKLWFFPKGLERDGGAGANSITWTSKYDSIITSSYDLATVDGINDQGLVVNLLFLEATKYGDLEPGEKALSLGGWGQYVLDNYATVEEAVQGLKKEPFQIVTAKFDDLVSAGLLSPLPPPLQKIMGQLEFALHLALSDPSGDSAIIEYLNGEQIIHHGNQYDVLTNDPTFDKQLALNESWLTLNTYWGEQTKNGSSFLPGTNSATSRFVRASYYLRTMEDNVFKSRLVQNRRSELAAALGIIRNVSDPLGLDGFAFTTTQWRALANQRKTSQKITNDPNTTYFFEYTKNPNVFWADINKLNAQNVGVMVFDDVTDPFLAGDVSKRFEKTCPFSWDISSTMDD